VWCQGRLIGVNRFVTRPTVGLLSAQPLGIGLVCIFQCVV